MERGVVTLDNGNDRETTRLIRYKRSRVRGAMLKTICIVIPTGFHVNKVYNNFTVGIFRNDRWPRASWWPKSASITRTIAFRTYIPTCLAGDNRSET